MSLPAAFILAGGASSRFGEEKARYPVEGAPMLLKVAAAMRGAGLQPRVIARDLRLEELGLPVLLEDAAAPLHPLNGVLAGLSAAPEGAIFCPCDMPRVAPALFARLRDAAPPAVARGQRVHPLLAHYPHAALPRVAALLASEGSARALAEGAEELLFPEDWLVNINYRADLGPRSG